MLMKLMGSVAATALLATASFAQDPNTAAPPVGEVIVDQADPQVDVTVPAPDLDVAQTPPEVTVDQPEPTVNVQQAPPQVMVEQCAPTITVTQAPPTVTVDIPQPRVGVRMADPSVEVAQGEPQVMVDTPEPVIRYQAPEPKIVVTDAEAEVDVRESEPEVDVATAEQARVNLRSQDPAVNVEEGGDAEVNVAEAPDPNVQVQDGGEADVNVNQGEPQVDVTAAGAPETETREGYQSAEPEMLTAENVEGADIYSADDQNIGQVNDLVLSQGGQIEEVIVGVGGFLGIGERNIALSMSEVSFQQASEGDELRGYIAAQAADIENMPEYRGE
ncbi:PRC-barrel domain-containing protein [Paracoccus sp. SM22M-07]|uniref:PRC-barrel domain-containing protein n=1 Tax=Paracoccus sp. SM22M-07 TaxID=1520813 RepID=UPI000930C770|nr:PRC-barrel domain-containing protein [Paracoccus sp. SM22M-07]